MCLIFWQMPPTQRLKTGIYSILNLLLDIFVRIYKACIEDLLVTYLSFLLQILILFVGMRRIMRRTDIET